MSPLASLWVAVGFLTRIPVGDPSRGGTREVTVGSAVPWFPVVGALIGVIQGGVWWALAEQSSPLVAAAVSTTVAVLVTGAFHHDGLADMADAFGGGWDVDQRMEILKDSRLGTYGTSALILALLLEVSALSTFEPRTGALALLAMHILGRALSIMTMLLAPAAGDGLGAAYMSDLPRSATVVVALIATVGAGVALGSQAWAIAPAVIAAACVVTLAIRKIGGVVGDVLGAISVVSGVTMLVAASL